MHSLAVSNCPRWPPSRSFVATAGYFTIMSADVSDPSFGLHFRRIIGPCGQLKHYCFLTFFKTGQKSNLSIRELQRVVMRRGALFVDLPENRGSVIEPLPEPA